MTEFFILIYLLISFLDLFDNDWIFYINLSANKFPGPFLSKKVSVRGNQCYARYFYSVTPIRVTRYIWICIVAMFSTLLLNKSNVDILGCYDTFGPAKSSVGRRKNGVGAKKRRQTPQKRCRTPKKRHRTPKKGVGRRFRASDAISRSRNTSVSVS